MSDPHATRRRLLVATVGAVGLTGCTADDVGIGGEPAFDEGTIDAADAPPRDPEELPAAAAVADEESHEGVTPIEGLTVTDHEFVHEDDVEGPTIQGTVENGGGNRHEIVEIRARVYDEQGVQLGRYLDSTGDLDGGQSWAFEVVVLEAPTDLASYDVAVLGTPT